MLADEDKRARYDRFGHAGVNGGGSGFPGGVGGFGGFEDIFDIFNSAFGEQPRGRRRGPAVGRDRRVDVTIDFLEAVSGVEKEIEFQRLESCESCDGSGAAASSGTDDLPPMQGQRRRAESAADFPRLDGASDGMRLLRRPRAGD